MPEVTNTSTKAQLGSSSAVTDEVVERAWAAIVGRDVAGICFQASIIRADLRTALEASFPVEAARARVSADGAHVFSDYDFDLLTNLVDRFSAALLEKLKAAEAKYGNNSSWARDDWKADCQRHLNEHLAKGDPRDVAAYCAFLWHHGWPTVGPMTPREYELVNELRGAAQPPANPWRDDFENAPTEMHEYFLVRPKGIHPGRGGLFLPTIVQRIDGEFYATDNEVDPIYFGQNEADDHPLKTTLEWQPLPSNWTCSISSTTRAEPGWSAAQFWEYVEGLTDAHVMGQIRDMLSSQGLSVTSQQRAQGE